MEKTKIEKRREELLEQVRNGTYRVCTKELCNMTMPMGKAYDKFSAAMKRIAEKSGLKLK